MPSERTYYVICEDNCRFESMTKEQIIEAIAEATGTTPSGLDNAFVTKLKEMNSNTNFSFWIGTTAQYNAIPVSDRVANRLYITTDETLEDEIDSLQTAITNITNGTTTVPNATHATSADSATNATNATNVKAKDNTFKSLSAALLEMIYPVGSIYMSVTNTSPATFLGGTWVAWGAGRVPVGVDTSDTDFDNSEETGGEKTHTLTIGETPAHSHDVKLWKNSPGGTHNYVESYELYGDAVSGIVGFTTSVGGGQAHNNLQPYITCYMWKRTA